jgi:hypothetical protein
MTLHAWHHRSAPQARIAHRSLATATVVAIAGLTFAPIAARAQGPGDPPATTSPAEPGARTAGGDVAVVDLQLQPDEVEAVLAILDLRAQGATIPESAWQRLFATEGYTRMMAREKSIDERMGLHRGFTDDKHRQFFSTDTALLGRRAALHDALDAWKHVHIRDAGERALDYLPPGTRIHGTIYPLLRAEANSFVFQAGTANPAIFMYMSPDKTPEVLDNTLAHEFHHLGFAAACPMPDLENERDLAVYNWLGGFTEGIAVLAAAGSPDADPLPGERFELRQAWGIRQDSVAADMAALGDFFLAVRDGRLEGKEANRTGFTFISRPGFPQGPFYTVGWFMASTVERELGRDAVIEAVCAPERLLVNYNRAAEAINARSTTREQLPRWPAKLLDAISRR